MLYQDRLGTNALKTQNQGVSSHSDGKTHDVDVFFEATGQLAVDVDTQNVPAPVNISV
jgi:hypothetical protein